MSRRKLAVLVAATLVVTTALAGPAIAVAPGTGPADQASCLGQDASTFARDIDEITGGQFGNLGEFISNTGAGPEFGPFVSERAQDERPCPEP